MNFRNIINKNDNNDKSNQRTLNEKYEIIFNNILIGKFNDYDFNTRFLEYVESLEIFDSDYYISSYDLPISKKYALLHYLNEGFKLGFNPSSEFKNEEYCTKYSTIEKLGLNPLVHYYFFNKDEDENQDNDVNDENENLDEKYQQIFADLKQNGFKNDKNLKFYDKIAESPIFDEDYYVSNHNVQISKKYALLHYLNEGSDLGYNPNPDFAGYVYLKNYPDVKKAGYNPLVHYVLFGQKEGREYPSSLSKKLKDEMDSLKNDILINRNIQNISLLKDKFNKNEKINVVFLLPAMMFVYKELYNYFDNDDHFNVQIVLVPHRIGNSKNINIQAKEKYYQIFAHLKERNFNVIEGFDFESNRGIDFESVCRPDILFYVLPYMRIYPENMKVTNIPPNVLCAYIPYGEFLESDLEDNLYNFGWNERIWKIFCSSESYLINAAEKSPVGSSNVIVVGSARMDSLVNYKPSEYDYKWIYPKEKNKKRIIWAPHHTLARPSMDDKVSYSTFDENFEFFYNYAKNNPDIEWVVRPHPLLKEILNNINTYMKIEGIVDENFVDDYFFKWNSLPNARVHEEIDYMDLFATADALITDCVSFKAEFLFANKPGLILTKGDLDKEGYENSIYSAWYLSKGLDFDEIAKFIEDVVVNENDYIKDKREEIFSEYLDFNTGRASKTIFDYIKQSIK